MLKFETLEDTQRTEEKIGENDKNLHSLKATCIDNKTFQLLENDQLLAELIYENMFSFKAKMKISESEMYDIASVGFFGTHLSVSKDGKEIVNLKMNWRGHIVFTFADDQELVLKTKGWFGNTFIMEDKDAKKLIQFDPKFNWRKFHYNYDISSPEKQDLLLILLGVYASNYYISSMSGAM